MTNKLKDLLTEESMMICNLREDRETMVITLKDALLVADEYARQSDKQIDFLTKKIQAMQEGVVTLKDLVKFVVGDGL